MPIVGASPAMVRVRIGVEQLSHRSRTPALILGQRGTGRRHCALALHAATYPNGEFFEFAAGAALAELEQRIAGLRSNPELTVGLTVYLPEIANFPSEVQRFLIELVNGPPLPCRLVASSSDGFAKLSRERKLRPDLATAFGSKLVLPPLSARTTDVAPLATHFSAQSAAREGTMPLTFSHQALEMMKRYPWPGNVAELAKLVERLRHEQGTSVVEEADLSCLLGPCSGVPFSLPATGIVFADLEKAVLTQALTMARNNQSRAASLLGMTRDQLRYRVEKFEIFANGTLGQSARRNR